MELFSMLYFWYLRGAAEDAYVRTDPQKGYEFDIDSVSLGWLTQIQPIIFQLINKDVMIKPHTNRSHYRLRFWHKELVSQIKTIKDNPKIVLEIKLEFQKQWVAGFFDAEGSVTTTGTNQPMLSIYSTNSLKIDILQNILTCLSLKSGKYLPKKRNVWQLFITGRDIISRFSNLIPIHHPEKLRRISSFLLTC